jgi:AcrR family transcriptional regulator
MAGRRKRKGEGHERREEILAAARALFLDDGYERTTVRRIVGKVGVTAPALYRHFHDKDEILLEIADRAFEPLLQTFRLALSDPDPLRGLRRLMEGYVRFGLDHPDEYRFVFMVKELVPPELSHRHGEPRADGRGGKGAQTFALLQQQVERLMDAAILRPGHPATVAELIWACGHGLVSLLITHPHFPWSDRELLIQGSIEMPLRGLLATP